MENGGEDNNKYAKGDGGSGPASAGKIFVGGLSWETTTEKLTKHFKKYGEVIDSVVMKDRATGRKRGFGFVTYADPSVVDKVVRESHLIDGRTVEIKRSVPKENMPKGPKTKKIFVGGLPLALTEQEFKNYFEKFGTVIDHQIMYEHGSKRSRGFGFITFDNEQTVDDLLSHNSVLELGGKEIEVKKAEPRKPAEVESNYGPPPWRDSYAFGGHGGYGGYDEGFGRYGSSLYGQGGRHDDDMYGGYGYGGGYGAYGGGGYGGYGSSMMGGGYDNEDVYGGRGHGGYGTSYGSGYVSMNGFGSSRGSGAGRYHPYARI